MLVGLSIAALVAANAALTKANGAGADLSTAEFLIGEITELTALLPVADPSGVLSFGPETGEVPANYNDLDDFDGDGDGQIFSPPINSERSVLNDCAGFSQHITVENVSPSDFEQVVVDIDYGKSPPDFGSDFVRVTVTVFLSGRQISSASWLRARY
jgi:hypothetical protein